MAPEMTELNHDERLIANIAASTCFCFRLDGANTPLTDVDSYVALILDLYCTKPDAATGMQQTPTVRDTVAFCAEQLSDCAPEPSFSRQVCI